MQWLRSLRPLAHSVNAPNLNKLCPGSCFLPPSSLARNFGDLHNMSSAELPANSENKRWRRPRGRKPRGGGNIASTTADPGRATLAARLAAPDPGTPIVSSNADTPEVSRPASPSYKTNFSSVRFGDLVQNGHISRQQSANIPFEFATEVQAKTLPHILAGKDVLARAKTGTGKTLAFLIPAIETLRRMEQQPAPGVASVLIVSPTRELAQQIGQEAETLVKGMSFGVEVITGGGPKVPSESNRLRKSRMHILVATPGRLVDHIQNFTMRDQLSQIRFLILDEADRLLDQGFRRDLEIILRALPDRTAVPRQALLFSATVSEEVKTIGKLALLPEYKYISTVLDNESATHEHVQQEHIIVEDDADIIPVVGHLVESRGKVICFLPTARATGLIAEVMDNVLSCPVYSIHSRMSQPRRTKATEDFKLAPAGVLFSSDVTARGIDIPGVTCVIQAGLPASAEQYIHRLGRTARAGNEGHGILVLAKWEQFFLRKKDVIAAGLNKTLTPHPDTAPLNAIGSGAILEDMRARVRAALAKTDEKSKEQAYIAWMGYYKGSLRDLGWTGVELVQRANDMARNTLLYQGYQGHQGSSSGWIPPPILAKTIGMMGLRDVRQSGLFNVVSPEAAKGGRNQGQEPGQNRTEGQWGSSGNRPSGSSRGRGRR